MSAKIGCFIMAALFLALGGCSKPDRSAPTISKLNTQLREKFENPTAHYQLGQIYQQQGDWDKAANEYDLALKFDPVLWDAHAALVKVLRLAGEEQQAAEKARDSMRQASAYPEDSLDLGRAYEKQNIDDYALAAYEQALKLAPKSAVVCKQIGYYYLARNNKEMAKTYFRRSFQLDPYQADVGRELGKMGIRVQVLQPPPPAPKPAPKK